MSSIHTPYNKKCTKKCTVQQQSVYFGNLNDRVLVKQGCDECSFTWGISKKVHETTVGKRELRIDRSVATFKVSNHYWNYLEICTDSVPAESRQLPLSVRNYCVTR